MPPGLESASVPLSKEALTQTQVKNGMSTSGSPLMGKTVVGWAEHCTFSRLLPSVLKACLHHHQIHRLLHHLAPANHGVRKLSESRSVEFHYFHALGMKYQFFVSGNFCDDGSFRQTFWQVTISHPGAWIWSKSQNQLCVWCRVVTLPMSRLFYLHTVLSAVLAALSHRPSPASHPTLDWNLFWMDQLRWFRPHALSQAWHIPLSKCAHWFKWKANHDCPY